MKRGREDELQSVTNMENYLMLMSRQTDHSLEDSTTITSSASRFFECKTCNRQFPSFQALGGHRASHKKPRLVGGHHHDHDQTNNSTLSNSPAKLKTHECSICGVEFAIGQALGGHMRRHRAAAVNLMNDQSPFISLNLGQAQEPVWKNIANGTRSVFGLDLNLTPSENSFLSSHRT